MNFDKIYFQKQFLLQVYILAPTSSEFKSKISVRKQFTIIVIQNRYFCLLEIFRKIIVCRALLWAKTPFFTCVHDCIFIIDVICKTCLIRRTISSITLVCFRIACTAPTILLIHCLITVYISFASAVINSYGLTWSTRIQRSIRLKWWKVIIWNFIYVFSLCLCFSFISLFYKFVKFRH